MFGRLTIRARLIGIAALFLIPIGLQVYLFVDQSRKDITFADKEVTGIAYLRAAWPAIHALAAAVNAILFASDAHVRSHRARAEAVKHVADQHAKTVKRLADQHLEATKAAVAANQPPPTLVLPLPAIAPKQ